MTFLERKITLQIDLGNKATFNPGGDNTVTIKGHRVHVSLTNTFGPLNGEARIRVYGLAPSLLNQIASLNQTTATAQANTVTVLAGDDTNGMAIAYSGQIQIAQADMSEHPESALNITAMGVGLLGVKRVNPTSYAGSADAAVILKNLATLGGLDFENSGASKILATPYFCGDLSKQIDDCARQAGFDRYIDKQTLAIWPRGGSRGGAIPLISADTGMVGFPSYTSMADGGGLALTCLYNKDLKVGGKVQVKSQLSVANGTWQVFSISHELESLVPGGQWFSHFNALFPSNG